MDAPVSGATFSQRGRPSNVLSHNGDILSFQFTPGLVGGGESQRGSELRVSRMAFHGETKAFPIKSEGATVISKSSSTSVDIVTCSSVVDMKTGLTVLCLLLKQRKKQGARFKYSLLTVSRSNSLSPLLEFKLPYDIKENLTLLQGPTVLWTNASIIYYTSLEAGEVKQVPLHLSFVSFIGELPLDKRKIIIFGSQISSKERNVDVQEAIWGQRNRVYFLEEGTESDGARVLPHAYSSVVKCMLFISAEEDKEGLKSTVVAATSRKQLVLFEGGAPRSICALPFEEPQNILMVDTGRNGCLFTISFSHGNVCTVWKDSFQVASSWQGVSSVLVDDFVGCGTDQLLILFDQCPSRVAPTNFIITDLGDNIYTSTLESSEGIQGADSAQENHLLTVKALESRLQSGMASIQDLQRDLGKKERVIWQAVQALTDLVSGRAHTLPSAQQEGLVSLWDDDEEEEVWDEELPAPPLAPPSPVEKMWLRVIEDRLVVGLQLTADAAALLESASVSFLIEAGQGPAPPVLQVNSRSFLLAQHTALIPDALSGLEPPPAKRKKAAQPSAGAALSSEPRPTVTAVTELAPLLACPGLPCSVLLHLAAAPCRAGGPLVVHCGFVSLDIQATALGTLTPRLLTDRSLATAEACEDLLSLLAAWDCWHFLISCSDHTLFDLPQWLLGALRCERLLVQPDYILCDPQRLPSAMLFQWQEKSAFTGELVVHCRGLHRLLQFLDSLCRCLPPSHKIRPLGQKRAGQDPGQALASALLREALALRNGVASLLHRANSREESEGTTGSAPTTGAAPTGSAPVDGVPKDPADELLRCRAEWGRERDKSRRRLSPLVDIEQYRRLVADLSQVQLETDIAALNLCELWPLPTAPFPDSPIPAGPNR